MKKTLSLLLCACLFAGCAGGSSSSQTNGTRPETSQDQTDETQSADLLGLKDEEFEEFLDQYVIDVCEMDYSTAHHYFEHPENYGVDVSKADITLGSLVVTKEDIEFTENILSTLKGWDPQNLSQTNQQIYQQMLWQYTLESESNAAKYDYVMPIWSEMSGVQSNLTDFFSEYQLFSKDDIDPLIKLIDDVPRYVKEALDYSKVQGDNGLLRLDLDSVVDSCQSILDSKDDSPIVHELDAEVDALMLDEKETEAYKEKIHAAMERSFFPSFQSIIDGLQDLKDKIGPIQGLASYPGGKEYYSLLLKYYTGTDHNPQQMSANMYQELNTASEQYRQIVKKDPKAAEESETLTTDFKNVSEIMPFLAERYAARFPVVDEMDYEVKPLSNEQSKDGVVAYFVVPPIDSNRTYEIRYNARDYGDDPSDLSLYSTFAHEGIPGHMYQTQYEKEHFTSTAQYFLSCFGMQEGYATYAAWQADGWLGLDEDALKVWKLSEMYSNYMILIMDMQINYDGMTLDEFESTWGDGLEPLYTQLAENPGVFYGYYYGYYMIDQLYSQAKEELGSHFDEQQFNNALLQAGNCEFSIVTDNIQNYIDSAK